MIGVAMLDNLTTFFDEMTGLVDKGQGVDIPHVDLSKAFDTVSHKILIDKLMKYGVEKTMR